MKTRLHSWARVSPLTLRALVFPLALALQVGTPSAAALMTVQGGEVIPVALTCTRAAGPDDGCPSGLREFEVCYEKNKVVSSKRLTCIPQQAPAQSTTPKPKPGQSDAYPDEAVGN